MTLKPGSEWSGALFVRSRSYIKMLTGLTVAILGLAVGGAGVRSELSQNERRPLKVVVLKDGIDVHSASPEMQRIHGVTAAYPCVAINGFAAFADPAAVRRLRADPRVVKVTPNRGRTGQVCAGE